MTNQDYLQWEPMLKRLARKYKNNKFNLDMEELIQIGALGLINVFDTYKDDKGTSRLSYYYTCVERYILKEFQGLGRAKRFCSNLISLNKQINNIYVNKNFDWNNNKSESLLLSQNEVLEIANTLIVALGFDLDTYKLDAQHINFSDEGYQICTFINKNNREDRFAIYISPTEKYIARYVRNP